MCQFQGRRFVCRCRDTICIGTLPMSQVQNAKHSLGNTVVVLFFAGNGASCLPPKKDHEPIFQSRQKRQKPMVLVMFSKCTEGTEEPFGLSCIHFLTEPTVTHSFGPGGFYDVVLLAVSYCTSLWFLTYTVIIRSPPPIFHFPTLSWHAVNENESGNTEPRREINMRAQTDDGLSRM